MSDIIRRTDTIFSPYRKESIENLNYSVRGTNERLDKAFDQQTSQFDEQKAAAFVGEHHKCHKALKTSNYESFKDINPSRAPETCRWVLENQTYLNWRDSLSNSLLWVSADPGCGKSVLSKSLIDIDSKDLEPETMVCHFFFKDNEQQNRLNIALCALLHQIFTQEPVLISHAMDAYNRIGDSIQQETTTLWNILLGAVAESKASQIICVLDALDECHSRDVELLIQKLREVFGKKEATNNAEVKPRLKFFVTSRPYLEIQALFSALTTAWPQIRLRGEEESDQIKKEIDIVIPMKMQQVAREAGLSSEVQKTLETQLLQMQNRTYLWLHLAIEDIRTTLSNSLQPGSESIRHVPATVDAAYANILARVQADQFSTVKKILLIVCGASRPLTISEMAIALGIALKPESSSIHSVQLDPARLSSRIRSLCGLFIIITDTGIHLLHQTAKDFLVRDNVSVQSGGLDSLYPLKREDTESTLAEICVRFLLMDDFRGSQYRFQLWCDNDSSLRDCPEHPVPGVYTFLHYSAENWAHHVRHMSSSRYATIEDTIFQLYDTSSDSFLIWFDPFWRSSAFRTFWIMNIAFDTQIHAPCLAALNGHGQLLKRVLLSRKGDAGSLYWNVLNERAPIYDYETCAFIWSSWAGHYDICCMLLEQGARLHPLAAKAALEQRDTKILQLLLERGGYSMKAYFREEACLQRASSGTDLNALLFLLDAGFNIDDGKGAKRGTALEKACSAGSIDMVKLLLDRGADVHARGDNDRSINGALYIACVKGNLDIARILLEKGAQVDRQDYYSQKPLTGACYSGNVDLVKLLVEKGAEINEPEHWAPLGVACTEGSIEIARILIEGGADVNASFSDGSSYLTLAFRHDKIDLGLMLLEYGAEVITTEGKFKSSYSMTPLQAVCGREGGLEAAKSLLDRGADINATMGLDDKPLTIACRGGYMDIIHLLLQNGAEADHGTFVAAADCVEVMELLRKQRPDFNAFSKDTHGMTALEAACRFTFRKECVEYLLNIGAHDQSPDFQKALDCALMSASAISDPQGVQILLDAGANLRFRDKDNIGALDVAARSGSIESMRLILRRGADISGDFFCVQEKESALEIALSYYHYQAEVLLSETCNGLEKSHRAWGNALLSACSNKSIEAVKSLLKAGASVQFQDDKNLSALHIASRHLDLSLVKLLLEHGADTTCPSTIDGYPLRIVCAQTVYNYWPDGNEIARRLKNQLDLVTVMLKHGADVNGHSGLSDTTALIEASQVGHLEMVKLLIQEGADINAVDKYEFSALMLAVVRGHIHIVRELLSQGAYINHRRTPTGLNCGADGLTVAYGADYPLSGIYIVNSWQTALGAAHWAAQRASTWAMDFNADPMIEFLLKNGAIF